MGHTPWRGWYLCTFVVVLGRAGAHPGLVGDAPGLGGPPPDPNADPAAQAWQGSPDWQRR